MRESYDSFLGINGSGRSRQYIIPYDRKVQKYLADRNIAGDFQFDGLLGDTDTKINSLVVVYVDVRPFDHTTGKDPVIRYSPTDDHCTIRLDGYTRLQKRLLYEATSPTLVVAIRYRRGIHTCPLIDAFELECLRPLEWSALMPRQKLDILDRFGPILI